MRLKYILPALAALSIALTQTITPAKALPGQSIKSFLKWAKNRPLPTQTDAIRTSNKHLNYVNAAPRSREINKDTTVKFSKYNEKALKLILKFYGSHSTGDFKKSRSHQSKRPSTG